MTSLSSRRYCVFLCAMILLCVVGSSAGGITGHSGIVLHVNKYGHFSGHSSHYDYRFYPEKSLLDHLMDHHHNPYSYPSEDPYGYSGEQDFYGDHEPLYYFQHEHMPAYHR
ncbi:uncharacterized protein LOC129989453 [Argiope bruennichi]|uniref:uncharacterized protein LOC129989453 n=1 Tax=Argiope bruennichi TaxID=94029 RepID=UPI0024941BA5|nr:uncharacterized protein LOC129989453 [Argiope bruennichi]